MAETDITRMSSDYADNELELFRTTVSSASGIRSRGRCHWCSMTFSGRTPSHSDGPDRWLGERPRLFHGHPQQGRRLDLQKTEEEWDGEPLEPTGAGQVAGHGTITVVFVAWEAPGLVLPWCFCLLVRLCLTTLVTVRKHPLSCRHDRHTLAHPSAFDCIQCDSTHLG